MHRITIRCGLLIFIFFGLSQSTLAGDILEPDPLEVTADWLTSDPQPGADFHILKACRDEDMTDDCTQVIYRANENGKVWIPTNNRCIYRVQNASSYTLYYQIKAASIDGSQSPWTPARKMSVYNEVVNFGSQSFSYSAVFYDTDSPLAEN